jgi:hypothetical protein
MLAAIVAVFATLVYWSADGGSGRAWSLTGAATLPAGSASSTAAPPGTAALVTYPGTASLPPYGSVTFAQLPPAGGTPFPAPTTYRVDIWRLVGDAWQYQHSHSLTVDACWTCFGENLGAKVGSGTYLYGLQVQSPGAAPGAWLFPGFSDWFTT